MKTVAQLENAIATVKPEDIGRAHLILCATGNFYKVQSSRDTTKEYAVRWNRSTGFTCECESGQRGFSNCKNGVCSHVLIALACKREETEAVAELQAQIAIQAAMSDPRTIAQAEAARETPVKTRKRRETAPIERKPFSILR